MSTPQRVSIGGHHTASGSGSSGSGSATNSPHHGATVYVPGARKLSQIISASQLDGVAHHPHHHHHSTHSPPLHGINPVAAGAARVSAGLAINHAASSSSSAGDAATGSPNDADDGDSATLHDNDTLAVPLTHRPALVRFASGGRRTSTLHSSGSASASPPAHDSSRASPAMPQSAPATTVSIDDMAPATTLAPGEAFESGVQRLHVQAELDSLRRERARQSLIRQSSHPPPTASSNASSAHMHTAVPAGAVTAAAAAAVSTVAAAASPAPLTGSVRVVRRTQRTPPLEQQMQSQVVAPKPVPAFAKPTAVHHHHHHHHDHNHHGHHDAHDHDTHHELPSFHHDEEDDDDEKGDQESSNLPSPIHHASSRQSSVEQTTAHKVQAQQQQPQSNHIHHQHHHASSQPPLMQDLQLPSSAIAAIRRTPSPNAHHHEHHVSSPPIIVSSVHLSPSAAAAAAASAAALAEVMAANDFGASALTPSSREHSPVSSRHGSVSTSSNHMSPPVVHQQSHSRATTPAASRQPSPARKQPTPQPPSATSHAVAAAAPLSLSPNEKSLLAHSNVDPNLTGRRPSLNQVSSISSNSSSLISPMSAHPPMHPPLLVHQSSSSTTPNGSYINSSSTASTPSSSGRIVRHVAFEDSIHPRSTPAHHHHMHTNSFGGSFAFNMQQQLSTSHSKEVQRTNSLVIRFPTQRKSCIKPPSAVAPSQHLTHVVARALSARVSAGASAEEKEASPIAATFSLRTPHASPLDLIQCQQKLFQSSMRYNTHCVRVTRRGAQLIKYSHSSSTSKPSKRWFWIQESDSDIKLCWCEPKQPPKGGLLHEVNPNGLECNYADGLVQDMEATATAASNKRGAVTPSTPSASSGGLFSNFSIGRWKFGSGARSRSLFDVMSLSYGPYGSVRFSRYLDKQDNASGKPWLCMSIQFMDRTIDIVAENEQQITEWYVGIAAQSTYNCQYMSRGLLLWQRTIMKLNWFGVPQIKRVLATKPLWAVDATKQLVGR